MQIGDTALHYAVRLRREDLVRFLLASGAVSLPGKYVRESEKGERKIQMNFTLNLEVPKHLVKLLLRRTCTT